MSFSLTPIGDYGYESDLQESPAEYKNSLEAFELKIYNSDDEYSDFDEELMYNPGIDSRRRTENLDQKINDEIIGRILSKEESLQKEHVHKSAVKHSKLLNNNEHEIVTMPPSSPRKPSNIPPSQRTNTSKNVSAFMNTAERRKSLTRQNTGNPASQLPPPRSKRTFKKTVNEIGSKLNQYYAPSYEKSFFKKVGSFAALTTGGLLFVAAAALAVAIPILLGVGIGIVFGAFLGPLAAVPMAIAAGLIGGAVGYVAARSLGCLGLSLMRAGGKQVFNGEDITTMKNIFNNKTCNKMASYVWVKAHDGIEWIMEKMTGFQS